MTTEISAKNYQILISKIRDQLIKAQENITRQKVETSWQVGKLVNDFLLENDSSNYGKNIFQTLEADINIASKTLYKMHSFYQTYPTLPENNPALNWSHYRALASIKDEDERKNLEKIAVENSWSGNHLQKQISEIKKENKQTKSTAKKQTPVKLEVNYGKLFTYKIIDLNNSDENFIDCGFHIFHQFESGLNAGDIASTSKINGQFSFKKISAKKPSYTYKAFLDRVIDGDTLRVNLDLGFGIFHRETLRLAHINAAEKKTLKGQEVTKKLTKILKDAPFLIIKTNKIDIYGRYIAEIFFENNARDENKVAKSGIHLNQMLLDLGLVDFVDY